MENDTYTKDSKENTITYSDGSSYRGDINENREPHGYGIFTYTNGWVYKGNFVNGELKDGKHIFTYPDGRTYEVNFLDGIQQDEGKYIETNGSPIEIETEEEVTDMEYFGGIYSGKMKYKKPHGIGKFTTPDGDTFVGEFEYGMWRKGIFNYADGIIYEGEFDASGKTTGEGKHTITEKETKTPLCTQVYDKNGMIKSVEYFFKKGDFDNKIVIYYDEINIALNKQEIKNVEDLRKYIKIHNKGREEEIPKNFDIELLIKQCAKYQMQTKLRGSSGKLDEENRIEAGYIGLQNLIILAELCDDIESLKRVRFSRTGENSSNIYESRKSFFHSFRLSNRLEDSSLTSIHDLSDKGTNYICISIPTASNLHSCCLIIDIEKLKNREKKCFYLYDSSRVVKSSKTIRDKTRETESLGCLDGYYIVVNHPQQKGGTCWLYACGATIAAAKYTRIVDEIRNGTIKQPKEWEIGDKITPNNFEILQMLTIQKIAEDFGIGRFGKDNKKMIHQIVNEPTRKAIKNSINGESSDKKIGGTYKSLLLINEKKKLGFWTNKELLKQENSQDKTSQLPEIANLNI